MIRRFAKAALDSIGFRRPRVAIFGASLSDQNIRRDTGETVGYAALLSQYLSGPLKSAKVPRFTFSGNRLSDGGLLRARELGISVPDICVLELLVQDQQRGRDATVPEVRYVYHRLLTAGIVPVTFLVALPLGRPFERFSPTAEARRICKTYDLPILEIDPSVSGLTFRGVHTVAESGHWLASQLGSYLSSLDLAHARAQTKRAAETFPHPPVYLKQLAEPEALHVRHLRFRITPGARPDPRLAFRILQPQIIGPHSPCIDVRLFRSNGEILTQRHSVWDAYCHYARRSYVHLAGQFSTPDEPVDVEVSVSTHDPEYATCRREVTHWPDAADRWLQPAGAFTLVSNAEAGIELLSART